MGMRLRGGWGQVASFCLGWKEKWVRLVNWFMGIPEWAPVVMATLLQGSRAGGGDYAAGRAKWLCEKGMGDEMLESTGFGAGRRATCVRNYTGRARGPYAFVSRAPR